MPIHTTSLWFVCLEVVIESLGEIPNHTAETFSRSAGQWFWQVCTSNRTHPSRVFRELHGA